jgi:type II secretory ATPase GspE/PulE/Tfp pilus assembly ATPase PilB-like protein
MVTLEQAGIIKALQGVTSLDEVYRVARKAE